MRYASIETISSVEVCFYQKECWRCHRPSYRYWISKLISNKGVSFRLFFTEEISPTDENIANGVTQYLRTLPNLNIIMGEIKPRYSKTRGQSYRSFGCPYCDSLFGDYFAMDDQMEMMYEEDHLPHAIIKLPKSPEVRKCSISSFSLHPIQCAAVAAFVRHAKLLQFASKRVRRGIAHHAAQVAFHVLKDGRSSQPLPIWCAIFGSFKQASKTFAYWR